MTFRIAALYRFTPIANVPALREELLAAFTQLELCGTLLIAPEGINGTLAGSAEAIAEMVKLLGARCGLPPEDVKYASAESRPFKRLKVRVKKEIITFRQSGADPTKQVGTYLSPAEWDKLLDDPDVLLLDTRNRYETAFGTFKGAVVPPIDKFTEFADYVRSALKASPQKRVAMFCTGGIRCEKASAFMLSEGFNEVYHLKGGILKYLEDTPQDRSRWQGTCYVFDERESVGHEDYKP